MVLIIFMLPRARNKINGFTRFSTENRKKHKNCCENAHFETKYKEINKKPMNFMIFIHFLEISQKRTSIARSSHVHRTSIARPSHVHRTSIARSSHRIVGIR